jgi:hypothetical protein
MAPKVMCSCCGQPLPPKKRGGVYLPPRKAQIFDAISRNPGISILGIIAKCYHGKASFNAVRVNICQINCLFMEAGVQIRIRGDGYCLRGCYRVEYLGELEMSA